MPMIFNGDHAQFEIDNVNTLPENRPDWPYPSFDARDWAKAYMKSWPQGCVDEDTMLAWFAGALMRGFDEGRMRSKIA